MPRKKPATTASNAAAAKDTVQTTEKKKQSKTVVARGLTVDMYDVKGNVAGSISLPKEIFAAKVNNALMAQAVRVYLANQRRGSASTKTRGEVRGSTRKIYRQKGTGRARHGAITAPIFVGGGVVFGPKPRDYSLKLPQKMKKAALLSALSVKRKDSAVSVVGNLEKLLPKTKEMVALLNKLHLSKTQKVLLVLPERIDNVTRAARNIANIEMMHAGQLNTYKVLESAHILFMQQAIDTLKKMAKGKEE